MTAPLGVTDPSCITKSNPAGRRYLDYQERVIIERDELKVKTDALLTFIQTNTAFSALNKKQQGLLEEQWEAMMHYKTLLDARIELF